MQSEMRLDLVEISPRRFPHSSSINTPTFNFDHITLETALSTLSPTGDLFAIQESRNNPYFNKIDSMNHTEIKSIKELCEKTLKQLITKN